jgi:hypothetical protein
MTIFAAQRQLGTSDIHTLPFACAQPFELPSIGIG